MDENKVNALVNIGQSKVVEKTYDDLVSPANKKLGNALSTIIDIGNTILWPVKWANERTRLFFEDNLLKYAKKLEEVRDEDIVTVPSEISIPVLRRFEHVSNKDLSDAFVNLLANASTTSTCSLAHPGFIAIIDRLSPDEAKILSYLKDEDSIPFIDINLYIVEGKSNAYHKGVENGTALEYNLTLNFHDNINIYFDNLCSLGILSRTTEYYFSEHEAKFDELRKYYDHIVNAKCPAKLTNEEYQKRIKIEKGIFYVTAFGRLFMQAIT